MRILITTLSCLLLFIQPSYASDGEYLYENNCLGCHQFGWHSMGPNHCGLMGRKIATQENFPYSKSMSNVKITWDSLTLNEFIKAPKSYIPGTTMNFTGIKDAADRESLINYLSQQATQHRRC